MARFRPIPKPFLILPAVLALLCIISAVPATAQREDLSVLSGWREYSDAGNALYKHMAAEAYTLLDNRMQRLGSLETADEWRAFTEDTRGRLASSFGPLPGRTPLEPRTTGTFEHEGIRVEKIIFESRPGFLVTTCLFKPADALGRLPAVVYVCGHTDNGFRSEAYQRVCLNLARKGFAVLAVDPIGQGERLQYYDENTGKSVVGGPTKEHSYAGLQYLPLGRTAAMVRLWDCIRAVDYLHTRDDIDTSRIGVHGRSGGGTMSAYLGAMDTRIAAAAPECYITSFERLLQSIGPQDGEQNLLSQIALGLDHGDFLLARAPRPTLVSTTTRDMFSIQGARETVRSVTPAFSALGSPDNIRMIEDNAPHQSTRRNRERVYSFFMEHFGISGSAADMDIPIIPEDDLRVSRTGQVATSGSRTVHHFIRKDARPALEALERSRREPGEHRLRVIEAARELSGFRKAVTAPECIFTGEFDREGYTVRRIVLQAHGEIPLPALAFVPAGGGRYPAVLYLDSAGKQSETGPGGLVERIVRTGRIVLTVDLPGWGELSTNREQDDAVINGVSFNLVFMAQLIGRSIPGIQATSISLALRHLEARDDVDGPVVAVARGSAGAALLHAAAFDTTLAGIALADGLSSWESLIGERFYDQGFGYTVVPSALPHYDLPDLMGLAASRRVLAVNPLDGAGQPAGSELVGRIRSTVAEVNPDADALFSIRSGRVDDIGQAILGWLE